MTLVVTGPTGNVGAELTDLLLAMGDDAPPFRLAAHDPAHLPVVAPAARLDYDDPSTFPAVLDDVSTLFLLFPLPHPKAVRTRMKPFIDAAVAHGVQHIVYLTVPGADRVKVVPHHPVERHIQESGAAWTFIRPSYFFQNLVRSVSTHGVDIAERGEVFIPAGRGATSFVDARDVAEVIASIMADPAPHKGASYVLTGPERLGFDEVASALSVALERPVRYAKPSFLRFWWRLSRRGVSWDAVLFMTGVYTLARLGRNGPQTDELGSLLGRAPRDARAFCTDYRWRWEQRAWT